MTSQTWIALLRGINVGGHNKLPMKDLRSLLSAQGFENVQTYIQCGNCIFSSEQDDLAALSSSIKTAIESQFGFAPQVFVMNQGALETALKENPFPQAKDDPKTLHVFFLSHPANDADMESIEALRAADESYALTDQAFYLYAPSGIGRSKLAAGAERKLKTPVTARNLRTVIKLLDMAS